MSSKSTHTILHYFQDLLEFEKLTFLRDVALEGIKENQGPFIQFEDTQNGILKYTKIFYDQKTDGPIEGLVTYNFFAEHRREVLENGKLVINTIDELVYDMLEVGKPYHPLLKNINQELHFLILKTYQLYPNYLELFETLKTIENHLLERYQIVPFAKKIEDDKLSYFGFKNTISKNQFIELYDLADRLEVIEYDIVDQNTFLEVFLENPTDPNKVIQFHCKNAVAKVFLERLRPYFTTLNPKSIEKSGRFLTKGNVPFKESNYNRTQITSTDLIDRLIQEMDTILVP